MLRSIHRQQGNIDMTKSLPDVIWGIMSIISPMDYTKPTRLYDKEAVIPGAGIIRRFNINIMKMFMDFFKS